MRSQLKIYLFLPNSHCTLVPDFIAQIDTEITALLVHVYTKKASNSHSPTIVNIAC